MKKVLSIPISQSFSYWQDFSLEYGHYVLIDSYNRIFLYDFAGSVVKHFTQFPKDNKYIFKLLENSKTNSSTLLYLSQERRNFSLYWLN